jgi:hypothetical protein
MKTFDASDRGYIVAGLKLLAEQFDDLAEEFPLENQAAWASQAAGVRALIKQVEDS